MVSNLLTASGVVCLVLAVNALAGIWWAVLLLGLVLLAAGFTSRPAIAAPSGAVTAAVPTRVGEN